MLGVVVIVQVSLVVIMGIVVMVGALGVQQRRLLCGVFGSSRRRRL